MHNKIINLWGKCKDGEYCKRRHVARAPEVVQDHPLFKALLKEHGPRNHVKLTKPKEEAGAAVGAQNS